MEIILRLRGHGFLAYFAGGCVRDELLGRTPEDYDVVTDAHPEQITSIFDRRFASQVGAHFGVVVVRIDRVMIEVATFRSDGDYSDKRRPDNVTFGGPEPDAQRRDFTINALFLDPLGTQGGGGTVIDYVGGYEDLQRKVLRAVGDPAKRLAEDHLRALRAARLGAKLGFTIDPGTEAAIAAHTEGLLGISRERIGDEVRRMIAHDTRATALDYLRSLGLLGAVFGSVVHGGSRWNAGAGVDEGPAHVRWPHSAGLQAARSDGLLTSLLTSPLWPSPLREVPGVSGEAWAALALDVLLGGAGGSSEGAVVFTGLPSNISEYALSAAYAWRTALCISNEEQAALVQSLTILGQLEEGFLECRESVQKRLAAKEAFPAACMLLRIRRPDLAGRTLARVHELCSRFGGLRPQPLVSGDDLITLGLRPGPGFKLLLDKVYDDQLEGAFLSAPEGLERARGYAPCG